MTEPTLIHAEGISLPGCLDQLPFCWGCSVPTAGYHRRVSLLSNGADSPNRALNHDPNVLFP